MAPEALNSHEPLHGRLRRGDERRDVVLGREARVGAALEEEDRERLVAARGRHDERRARVTCSPVDVRTGIEQQTGGFEIMHYDLGYFDDETCRLEPIENPFGPKVLPMCSE